jgi:hypothetical protein
LGVVAWATKHIYPSHFPPKLPTDALREKKEKGNQKERKTKASGYFEKSTSTLSLPFAFAFVDN